RAAGPLRRGRGPGRRTASARWRWGGCGRRALARPRPPLRAPRRRPADPRGRGVGRRQADRGGLGRWVDVVVEPEDIARVVALLDGDEPGVVRAPDLVHLPAVLGGQV